MDAQSELYCWFEFDLNALMPSSREVTASAHRTCPLCEMRAIARLYEPSVRLFPSTMTPPIDTLPRKGTAMLTVPSGWAVDTVLASPFQLLLTAALPK